MTDVSPTQKAKEAIDPRCKEEKKRRNSDPIQKDNEWKRQFKREEIDKTDFSNSFVEQPFWLKGEIYEVYHEGGKVKSIVTTALNIFSEGRGKIREKFGATPKNGCGKIIFKQFFTR